MTAEHVPALKLRRFFVGESLGDEHAAVAAHTQSCSECRGRLRQLEEEQSRFFSAVSADRFAAGVERAARVPRPTPRPATGKSFFTFMSLGFVATCFALYLGVKPMLDGKLDGRTGAGTSHRNSIKGAAGVSVRIAAARAASQREATAEGEETLLSGERVRVGYDPKAHGFIFVFSVDDHGRVSSLYPEAGKSLPVVNGQGIRYFPDSLEFTGAGLERLVVTLSDEPLSPQQVQQAAEVAFRQAGGDVSKMGTVTLPGEQFHRLFRKTGGQ